MHLKHYIFAAVSTLPVLAQSLPGNYTRHNSTVDPFKQYIISAENITAKFIPYGARLTSVLVPDRLGRPQDVVVGYDDPKQYVADTEGTHTYAGAVVGRYANRIKNATFTIDGIDYHTPRNENGGADTIHGGSVGYDQRNWTVVAHSPSSITFGLIDRAEQGFPGDVINHVTFVVSKNPRGLPQLISKVVSSSLTKKTPIMLSNHIYWNLNAFKQPTVLNDTFLQLPLSSHFVASDSLLVPNGTILESAKAYQGATDFTRGKLVGQDIHKTQGLCGAGCTGYDTCFLVDRPPAAPNSLVPVLHMNSSTTGISLEVSSNQPALQIFSCPTQDGTLPVKPSQTRRNKVDGYGGTNHVNKYGCVVIENEGWIDGINNPQWGQVPNQVFSPEDLPAINYATYTFGTIR